MYSTLELANAIPEKVVLLVPTTEVKKVVTFATAFATLPFVVSVVKNEFGNETKYSYDAVEVLVEVYSSISVASVELSIVYSSVPDTTDVSAAYSSANNRVELATDASSLHISPPIPYTRSFSFGPA